MPVVVGATTYTVSSEELGNLEQRAMGRMDLLDLRDVIDRASMSNARPAIATALQQASQSSSTSFITDVPLGAGAAGMGFTDPDARTIPARTFHLLREDLHSLYVYASLSQTSSQQRANEADRTATAAEVWHMTSWMLRLGIEMIPVYGEVVQAVEAITGYSITGDHISREEQALLAFGLLLGGIGRLGEVGESISTVAHLGDEFVAARITNMIPEFFGDLASVSRTIGRMAARIDALTPAEIHALERLREVPELAEHLHSLAEANHLRRSATEGVGGEQAEGEGHE